jgi:hypothetical protein
MVCNKWLHFLPETGKAKGYDCFFKWQDEAYVGLRRMDSVRMYKKWKNDQMPPNRSIKLRNERHVAKLKNNENDKDTEDGSSSNEGGKGYHVLIKCYL